MKKILFILISLFIFSGIVNAEKCTVVTGDGSHLGDEIKCGTEYFYIMKTNNETTELLAKYNLFAGDKIDFIPTPELDTDEYWDSLTDEERDNWNEENFCLSKAQEKGYDPYLVVLKQDYSGCRVYEKLNPDHIRQDERAQGTMIKNNDSVLPIYGITYMVPEWGYDAINDDIIHTNDYDSNDNLILEDSTIEEYIVGYKNELKSQGIDVVSVGTPVVGKLIEFLQAISGREVESDFEQDPNYNNSDSPYFYTEKMDIKDYIPEKYNWLYDRAYWLGSGYENSNIQGQYADYYISNEGYLCLMGRGICLYFPYPIGNGLRPLVTIKTEDINFVIETKTDGNGEVKAEKIQARGGEVIKFTVTPNKGYVLSEVKVTDSLGKVVIFKDYTFTMPNANVLIEAKFVPENPNTKAFISYLIIVISGIAGMSFYLLSQRKKQLNKVV